MKKEMNEQERRTTMEWMHMRLPTKEKKKNEEQTHDD